MPAGGEFQALIVDRGCIGQHVALSNATLRVGLASERTRNLIVDQEVADPFIVDIQFAGKPSFQHAIFHADILFFCDLPFQVELFDLWDNGAGSSALSTTCVAAVE